MTEKKNPDLHIVGGAAKPKAKRAIKPKRLTAKQQQFVAGIMKGLTASDAYRAAYDVGGDKSKGKAPMKASAIWVESSRLIGHPLVSLRLSQHRASEDRAVQSSSLSRRRWIVERLEHESVHAESDAARVRSLELLGKTTDIRLFADIVETMTSDASVADVKAQLEAKLTALLGGRG